MTTLDMETVKEAYRAVPFSEFVPAKPTGKQLAFLANMGKEALYGGTARSLDVDTPIPTPSGWTTMGALEVGDQVFTVGGVPANVDGVSLIADEETWTFTFSNGSALTSHSGHEWKVWWNDADEQQEKATTADIVLGWQNGWTYQFPCVDGGRTDLFHVEHSGVRRVKCVSVDHPSHLFVAGTGGVLTHNSMKSWAALMAALQYVCVPGYAAIIFRKERASLKLPDGLIPISQMWLGDKARWSAEDFQWTFPSGATLNFGYLGNSDDLIKYHSSAYQFCVAPDTPIIMGDGSFREIQRVRPGDEVWTLEGPRRVLHSEPMGVRECVEIQSPHGSLVCSDSHRIMGADGGWATPLEHAARHGGGRVLELSVADRHTDSYARMGGTYVHPYTATEHSLHLSNSLSFAVCPMVPVGVREVWDIEVEGANHYVPSNGIVVANCLFEEVAEWPTNSEYVYMFSRLTPKVDFDGTMPRCECHGWSVADVPLRMRATANPGGPGQAWVRQNFILPSREGKQGLFHPASYKDNPYIDPVEYEKTVGKMRSIDRARLLGGDWDISAPGDRFSRDWFKSVPVKGVPPDVKMIRFWDLAGTKVKATNRDPDWTVGALVAHREVDSEDFWYLLDIVRFRATSGEVRRRMRSQTKLDDKRWKRHVPIRVEREPGSMAKMASASLKAQFKGLNFRAVPSRMTKSDRIDVLAVEAEVGEGVDGGVFLVEGLVEREVLLDEAEAYGNPGVHDDILDAISGAMIQLSKGAGSKTNRTSEAAVSDADDPSSGYPVRERRTRSVSGMSGGYSDFV